MKRCLLFVACAGAAIAVAAPADAQLTAPVRNGDTTITVTGRSTNAQKVDGKKIEMSGWRMAETPHVAVFSRGDEKRLRATAHNLEKLHFLLSALLGRVDQPDNTIKISVTIIGDAAEFEHLRLTDSRWQYGPYPHEFAQTIYYDPRPEGPVLATTETGLNLILRPSTGRATSRNCGGDDDNPISGNFPVLRPSGESIARGSLQPDTAEYLSWFAVNEITVCQTAESRLYSGFAQNYLMTYFPAAYPRWFVQGFGELFSTIVAGDTSIDYGRRPEGFFKVMDRFGEYPIKHVFDGRYLTGEGRAWTPYHAWRMVHFLYFNDTWKPRLEQYLAAVAGGADPKRAASVFGKPADLQRAVMLFRGSKAPFDRVTFPADRIAEPTIRRLTRAEAGLIRGRLEMGARIDVPDSGPKRDAALARRTAWLERLRGNATRFPDLIENQLLLAEAECRAGNPAECLAAADRALAQSPADTNAMVWKGTALTQLAMRAPANERRQRLDEARGFIVKANRQDPDGILPLIAYYNSFEVAGDRATDVAVGGLYKVVQAAPAAPEPRLKLGEELVARDIDDEARSTLLPVAKGPFETPEQAAAAALLPKVSGR